MFPEVDGTSLRETIRLFPDGTPQGVTEDAVALVLTALNRIGERIETTSEKPLIVHTIASVGQTRGGGSGTNVGSVEAVMLPAEERGIHSSEVSVIWEKEVGGIIQTDFSPGKNEMRFSLKPEAGGYGLTVSDLAQQIQAGYYGSEAVRILRGTDDIRVKVRFTEEERSAFASLDTFRIRTPDGHEFPLLPALYSLVARESPSSFSW